ncbi:tetratricopeptide repeat protein, partial [Candidatus Moduliflexota bacterium]
MKVNEAYTVLGNPGKRAEYDRVEIRLEKSHLEHSQEGQDSRVAREQYRKGMELLKAGDPWAASESFRWAVHLNPRSALFHTWLGASLARTRKRLHEAEEHCKTAITLDYSNPLFYVHLGQVYLAGRLNEKARKQFETALKLDPGHVDARKALEVVKGEGQDKSLFDKLFKK